MTADLTPAKTEEALTDELRAMCREQFLLGWEAGITATTAILRNIGQPGLAELIAKAVAEASADSAVQS